MARPKKTKEVTEQNNNTVSTLFGAVKEDEVVVDTEKSFGVFDFINDINYNKQYLLDEGTQKDYDSFTVNRAMTIFPDTFIHGEFLNSNYHLDKRMQHDYLFYSVSKKKRWKQGGWMKRSEAEKKELKLLQDVARVCGYNMIRTKEIWSMMTGEQRDKFVKTYVYPDANK